MKIDRKGLKAQAKQAIRAAARIDFLRPEGGESPLQPPCSGWLPWCICC